MGGGTTNNWDAHRHDKAWQSIYHQVCLCWLYESCKKPNEFRNEMFAADGSVQSAVHQMWAALDEGFTMARGEAGLHLGGSRSSCYSWVINNV